MCFKVVDWPWYWDDIPQTMIKLSVSIEELLFNKNSEKMKQQVHISSIHSQLTTRWCRLNSACHCNIMCHFHFWIFNWTWKSKFMFWQQTRGEDMTWLALVRNSLLGFWKSKRCVHKTRTSEYCVSTYKMYIYCMIFFNMHNSVHYIQAIIVCLCFFPTSITPSDL